MPVSKNITRLTLKSGAALAALVILPTPLAANETENGAGSDNAVSAQPVRPADDKPLIEERQSYALRLMMQVYNGEQDFSHTQLLGVGRVRKGNRSLTQFDYGDGAVVIRVDDGKLAAGKFLNVSETEKLVVYNYDSKTMQGDPEIANFHNIIVRPWLDRGPELGENVSWSLAVPISALGMTTLSGDTVQIELTREYFIHDGKPMVLVHYAIPAFSYDDGTGRTVVQWARGLSLTDPGFGMIYLNSALQRAVAREDGGVGTPYRFARTMVAANTDGSAMIDYRKVPQLEKHIDALFGKEAMQVVPVNFEKEQPDERPLELGRRLDLLALSIGENGANEVPATAAAQGANDRGVNTSNASNIAGLTGTAGGLVGNLYTWSDVAAGSPQSVERVLTIMKTAEVFKENGRYLQSRLDSAVDRLKAAEAALVNSRSAPIFVPTDELKTAQAFMLEKKEALRRAEELYDARLPVLGKNPVPSRLEVMDARMAALKQAQNDYEYALTGYELLSNEPSSYSLLPSPADARAAEEYRKASEEVVSWSDDLVRYGDEGLVVLQDVKNIPPTHWDKAKSALGNSLTLLGNAINGYTIGSSVANLQKQAGQNLATGQAPSLTRTYSYTGSVDQSGFTFGGLTDINLGLDLLGMVGAAASGDVVTALTTAAAIGTSSVSDIIISAKALKDVNVLNTDAAKLARDLARRQKEEYIRKSAELERKFNETIAALDADIADLDSYSEKADEALKDRMTERGLEPPKPGDPDWMDPRIDPDTGFPKPAYWAWLKINNPALLASYGIDPEAPVGGWPGGVGPEHRPQQGGGGEGTPNPQDTEGKNEPLPPIPVEPDYPTAPPRDSDQSTDQGQEASMPEPTQLTPAEARLLKNLADNAKASKELETYQQQKLDELKAKQNKGFGNTDLRTSQLEMSALVVSALNIDTIKFDAEGDLVFDKDGDLVFDKDGDLVFDKDGDLVFDKDGDLKVDPVDPSRFPPTDPDDLDGYPGIGDYPAATWDTMVGTEPDISKWEEWLATQNRRLLEQLARAAGYPSLAFALADAERIIRLSLDPGYRGYANRGPNCAGTTGCTGSIGPWRLAYATIRLGDILAQSREIFSTGGFSDIGISGFNLMYILRDFGIEDGDLIDVDISQFGRDIFKLEGHFLLNEGSPFNVRLRPGVAQMVITALNEGSARPNTAEITIDNVVRGDARQTYSLSTGQTAVLKIEANATPGTTAAQSASSQLPRSLPTTAAPAGGASTIQPVRDPVLLFPFGDPRRKGGDVQ